MNDFIVFFYNFLFGGAFLRHLVSIDELMHCDQSAAFGRYLLWSNYLFVFLVKMASMWLFERETLLILVFPENGTSIFAVLIKLLFETFYFLMHFISLMMHSLWFIYCMVHFRRSIEYLHREVKLGKETVRLKVIIISYLHCTQPPNWTSRLCASYATD